MKRIFFMLLAFAALGLVACQDGGDEVTGPQGAVDKYLPVDIYELPIDDRIDPIDPIDPIEPGDAYIQRMDLAASGEIGIRFSGTWNTSILVDQVYLVNGVPRSTIPFSYHHVDGDIAYYRYNYTAGMDLTPGSLLSSELRVNRVAVAQQVCFDMAYESADLKALAPPPELDLADFQLVSINGVSSGSATFSTTVFNTATSDLAVELYEDGQLLDHQDAHALDSRTLSMSVVDFDALVDPGTVSRTKNIVDGSSVTYSAVGTRSVAELVDGDTPYDYIEE